MKAFLAVSTTSGTTHPAARGPAPDVLDRLAGTGSATVHPVEHGWIAYTEPDPSDRLGDPALGFTGRLTQSVRGRTGDVDMAGIAKMLGDGSSVDNTELAGLLPPFGAAHHAGPGTPILLAGDWLGLRQLFWWQGDGVAAFSTSALALAALAGAGLDLIALGLQSVIGWQVGLDTTFRGIAKLPPGSVAILRGGTIAVHRYADETMDLDGRIPPFEETVDEMAQLMRDFHDRYLADHPDTVLQLTGGQDSRLLLAAVPPSRRPGLTALTIDVPGGVESRIAARLSELCGLEHHVQWRDEGPTVDPGMAHDLAIGAAAALNCMASPLALAPLTLVESRLAQNHRLSGLGGEVARGFYYLGQPRHASTSPQLVRRLAEWRLFTNERVAPDALQPDFAASARAAALAAVNASFAGHSNDWLRATDEFYLWQRTQRWAGSHSSAAAVDRWFVNPMLDRRFLQLALAPPPEDKRDSHLMGQLIRRLDPQLASIPLDTGLVPARLGRRGVATTTAVARVSAGKMVRKIRQRIGGGRRPQLGAAELADLVVRHWRAQPDVVRPLRQVGVIREAWLDDLLADRRGADAATVAFLVNLLVATEVTARQPTPAGHP